MAAAPAPNPVIPIAIPIATVEIGEIINIENETLIKIHINNGCKVVKLFIISPITIVICLT